MNSDYWLQYFAQNQLKRPEPDWHAPVTVPANKIPLLVKSLAQFQLGDGGGPASLIAENANNFTKQTEFHQKLVDLWFTEEREHSRLLGDALKRFDGKPISAHWSFSLFCFMRQKLGVNFELTILLLTEIVSTIHYRLLGKYSHDVALQDMCRLIGRDEAGHIRFHCDRLAQDFSKSYDLLWEVGFRVLGICAGTALWINHRGCLIMLGATDSEFYKGIWQEMSVFIRQLRRKKSRDNQQ